jgi:hypothetical protein
LDADEEDFWRLVEDLADGDLDGDQPPDMDGGEGDGLTPDASLLGGECPLNPKEFVLKPSHTWDFSPNRDTANMQVDGSTQPNWECPLVIDGRRVNMPICQVPITTAGFVMTDEGPCDITAAGYMLIELDEPRCEDGVLITRIIEAIDADAETTGQMVCPGMTQPYFPFFPHSNTAEKFPLQPGGSTQTESADPDATNQFRYLKEWRLVPSN